MATKTLWELMEAVDARVTASTGLRSTLDGGDIMPPAIIVDIPPVGSYRAAMARGTVLLEGWPLYVLTSKGAPDRVGRKALAEYLSWTGATSVVKALEDEPTLGGAVSDLIVESSRPLGTEEAAGLGYWGGVLMLTVTLPGT